jgi:NAD(P)-dependent dehydrogenase (short-subunit alcohol dehydrogenase family)
VKSLLITGGTGGLGQAVVARLEREYRCVLLPRNGTTDEAAFYGVIHLAGGFTMGSSLDQFTSMLDSNLMSAVRANEPIRSRLEDGGRIVAISSADTLTRPGGMAAYVAAKSALNGYIEVLAKELQPRSITVNALLPTALDTPAMRKSMSRDPLIPLDRVSETIAFLLRGEAASITGQLIALTR